MPTKLKQPITITIEHVENAVAALIKSEWFRYHNERAKPDVSAREWDIMGNVAKHETFNQLVSALSAQGIDWRTWIPPQPLTIGGHAAEFSADGSMKFGDITVSSEQFAEIVKRREEAMQGEWPKYFLGSTLWRSRSAKHRGEFFDGNQWQTSSDPDPLTECVEHDSTILKPTTRAKAAELIGEENL